jgi:hypothetical protein
MVDIYRTYEQIQVRSLSIWLLSTTKFLKYKHEELSAIDIQFYKDFVFYCM